MAVRQFNVTIVNDTGYPLQQTAVSLDHGEWSSNLTAPTTIAVGATAVFQSESDGIMTGTQGHAVYRVLDNNDITTWLYVTWDNPYVGTSTFNAVTSTVAVDAAGNPANPVQGGFNSLPPESPYEVGFGTNATSNDGTVPTWNLGSLAPGFLGPAGVIFDVVSIFADGGNVPNSAAYVQLALKATDYITWGKRHARDLSKGLRALNPPGGSLRALMQLPPAHP
jgi:hypothetical protein